MEILAVIEPGKFYSDNEFVINPLFNSGTLPVRLLRAYKVVPNGAYTPKELGLDLPKCEKINVGICSHIREFKRVVRPWWKDFLLGLKYVTEYSGMGPYDILDHYGTRGHVCSNDPRTMCIKDGNNILFGEGQPSETVLHEYAHILASFFGEHDHDAIWESIMLGLGQSPTLNGTYHVI